MRYLRIRLNCDPTTKDEFDVFHTLESHNHRYRRSVSHSSIIILEAINSLMRRFCKPCELHPESWYLPRDSEAGPGSYLFVISNVVPSIYDGILTPHATARVL